MDSSFSFLITDPNSTSIAPPKTGRHDDYFVDIPIGHAMEDTHGPEKKETDVSIDSLPGLVRIECDEKWSGLRNKKSPVSTPTRPLSVYFPSPRSSRRYSMLGDKDNVETGVNRLGSLRRLQYRWITVYHLLVLIVFVINLAIFFTFILHGLTPEMTLDATSVNIFAAVLIRQEDLLNLLYDITTSLPLSAPFFIRKHLANFHHYGGLHIGCAVSSLLWYGAYVYLSTRHFLKLEWNGDDRVDSLMWTDVMTCYVFFGVLLLICLAAFPFGRRRYHDFFERTHRFGGWFAIAVLWVHAVIHSLFPTAASLHQQPSMYFLAATTFLLILPWLRIQNVDVIAEQLSTKEVMLWFKSPNMPYCSTMRFSTSPLVEWHAFATIPSFDRQVASIVIAAAGDWTKGEIAHPPSRIWLRNPPAHNFLLATRMFRSVLLVGTGAGIGPILSLLLSLSPDITEIRQVKVLWCAHRPYAPHWKFGMDIIYSIDPFPKIFDTSGPSTERPDLVFETRHAARVWNVEAVFVVSNKKVTHEIVGGVKGDNIPAYGAVFDS